MVAVLPSMKSVTLIAMTVLGAAWVAHSYFGRHAPRPADGVLVSTPPTWGGLTFERHTAYQDFGSNQIIPMATLDITGRVLARKEYPTEDFGERIRTDLVLGWGRMSDNRVLDHLTIGQANRGVEIVLDRAAPLKLAEAYGLSINLSVYSDYDAATEALNSIVVGDVIRLVGWQMRLKNAQGKIWEGGAGNERPDQNYGIILVLKLQVNDQKKFGNWDAAAAP